MKGNEFIVGLLLGAFLTGLSLLIVIIVPQLNTTMKYSRAIDECEKNLPRTQYCKVIGVIDNEQTN